MRRLLSFLLCFMIAFSCCCAGIVPVTAQKTEGVFKGTGSEEYTKYLKANEKLENTSQSIKLDFADGVISQNAKTDKDGVSLTEKGDSIEWKFDVKEEGWYEPRIEYLALQGNSNDIEIEVKLDGNVPYPELETVLLPRIWQNAVKEFQLDEEGNQYSPEQIELSEWQTQSLLDDEGFCTDNLKVALKKGTHTLKITVKAEKVKIKGITFGEVSGEKSYKEYKAQFDAENYKGEALVYEGEKAEYKSQKSFIPLTNRNDAEVTPANPFRSMMNYIGGGNWNDIGGTITWEVNAPQDGFYQLNFHFRQNYLQESNSYRTLLIDGEIPFEEAKTLAFGYKSGWQFMTLGEDMPVYLTKGQHTVSLRVTLGALSNFAYGLRDVTNRLGKIYRQIVRITGESPDANRDYDLFIAIPTLEEDLTKISKELEELALESEKVSGSKGGSNAQIIRKAKITVDKMLKVKYEAHTSLASYYDNYSSLSSWLYEMQSMALDINSIALTAPDSDGEYVKTGFFENVGFSFKRLFSTFISDYENTHDEEGTLVLWSNWGRDQINILENLIVNDFTPKTGIKVNVKITTASLIEAGLSGNGPDIEINSVNTNILNYAMRGVLYDLSKFDDFDEICRRFSKNAIVPYEYKDGVYGLPNTESFPMMFIRNDIFEELGLTVPTTWEEFIDCAKVITLNNMNCGLGADAYTFMTQMGVPLYSEDKRATNLLSKDSVKAFTVWTDFYTKYNFPVSYDFFNRFRTGLMPMGIAVYPTYATIRAAAPEINGKWQMYEVPGTVLEDGTVNNSVNGTGTASMILDWSEYKDKAWEFLKWWSSEDIQYRFGINLESVLGVSGRYASATLDSVYRFGWDAENLEAIKSGFESLENLPQVPGSYYVARSVQQVYWNVVNLGENVEDMLNEWVPEADDEIKRKTEEYYNKDFGKE